MAIKRIGKYNVQGQLGKGAQSTILQISRAEDGRQYALKVVPINSADDKKYHEQAEHEFRVAQIGNSSAGGGVTGSTGTFRLTAYFVGGQFDRNLQFTGNVIPTPGSLALMGLGGLLAARRRR